MDFRIIVLVDLYDEALYTRNPDSITLTIYPRIRQLIINFNGALDPSQVTLTAEKLISIFARALSMNIKGYVIYSR